MPKTAALVVALHLSTLACSPVDSLDLRQAEPPTCAGGICDDEAADATPCAQTEAGCAEDIDDETEPPPCTGEACAPVDPCAQGGCAPLPVDDCIGNGCEEPPPTCAAEPCDLPPPSCTEGVDCPMPPGVRLVQPPSTHNWAFGRGHEIACAETLAFPMSAHELFGKTVRENAAYYGDPNILRGSIRLEASLDTPSSSPSNAALIVSISDTPGALTGPCLHQYDPAFYNRPPALFYVSHEATETPPTVSYGLQPYEVCTLPAPAFYDAEGLAHWYVNVGVDPARLPCDQAYFSFLFEEAGDDIEERVTMDNCRTVDPVGWPMMYTSTNPASCMTSYGGYCRQYQAAEETVAYKLRWDRIFRVPYTPEAAAQVSPGFVRVAGGDSMWLQMSVTDTPCTFTDNRRRDLCQFDGSLRDDGNVTAYLTSPFAYAGGGYAYESIRCVLPPPAGFENGSPYWWWNIKQHPNDVPFADQAATSCDAASCLEHVIF